MCHRSVIVCCACPQLGMCAGVAESVCAPLQAYLRKKREKKREKKAQGKRVHDDSTDRCV